jgi:hypothetical protein
VGAKSFRNCGRLQDPPISKMRVVADECSPLDVGGSHDKNLTLR